MLDFITKNFALTEGEPSEAGAGAGGSAGTSTPSPQQTPAGETGKDTPGASLEGQTKTDLAGRDSRGRELTPQEVTNMRRSLYEQHQANLALQNQLAELKQSVETKMSSAAPAGAPVDGDPNDPNYQMAQFLMQMDKNIKGIQQEFSTIKQSSAQAEAQKQQFEQDRAMFQTLDAEMSKYPEIKNLQMAPVKLAKNVLFAAQEVLAQNPYYTIQEAIAEGARIFNQESLATRNFFLSGQAQRLEAGAAAGLQPGGGNAPLPTTVRPTTQAEASNKYAKAIEAEQQRRAAARQGMK
jgi:hypothetical protein